MDVARDRIIATLALPGREMRMYRKHAWDVVSSWFPAGQKVPSWKTIPTADGSLEHGNPLNRPKGSPPHPTHPAKSHREKTCPAPAHTMPSHARVWSARLQAALRGRAIVHGLADDAPAGVGRCQATLQHGGGLGFRSGSTKAIQ